MIENEDLFIADIFEAEDLVRQNPGVFRVLSILNPGSWTRFSKAREFLLLEFHDLTPDELQMKPDPSKYRLATKQQCQQALDFLNGGGKRLVHCNAGKRRSTAIALGYLLQNIPNRQQAVETLFRIRPIASPNQYVLKLACEILEYSDDDFMEVIALIAFCSLNKTKI